MERLSVSMGDQSQKIARVAPTADISRLPAFGTGWEGTLSGRSERYESFSERQQQHSDGLVGSPQRMPVLAYFLWEEAVELHFGAGVRIDRPV